jgi:hypothetical protein
METEIDPLITFTLYFENKKYLVVLKSFLGNYHVIE